MLEKTSDVYRLIVVPYSNSIKWVNFLPVATYVTLVFYDSVHFCNYGIERYYRKVPLCFRVKLFL